MTSKAPLQPPAVPMRDYQIAARTSPQCRGLVLSISTARSLSTPATCRCGPWLGGLGLGDCDAGRDAEIQPTKRHVTGGDEEGLGPVTVLPIAGASHRW